jgi:GntR family transcriptional repressor for pyruvate dehydrogenase complex
MPGGVRMDKESKAKYKRVLNKLIEFVVEGVYEPGQKIHSENRLASLLGINRSVVRDVYNALEIVGVVRSRQGEGTYLEKASLRDSRALFLMTLLAEDSIDNILEVRRILELFAAELAALKRTSSVVMSLEKCHIKMQMSKNPLLLAREDVKFHGIIAKATHNNLLSNLVYICSGYFKRIAVEHWYAIMEREDSNRIHSIILEQHAQIAQAIADGKADFARSAMKTHLYFVEERLKKILSVQPNAFPHKHSLSVFNDYL